MLTFVDLKVMAVVYPMVNMNVSNDYTASGSIFSGKFGENAV